VVNKSHKFLLQAKQTTQVPPFAPFSPSKNKSPLQSNPQLGRKSREERHKLKFQQKITHKKVTKSFKKKN